MLVITLPFKNVEKNGQKNVGIRKKPEGRFIVHFATREHIINKACIGVVVISCSIFMILMPIICPFLCTVNLKQHSLEPACPFLTFIADVSTGSYYTRLGVLIISVNVKSN